MNQNQPNKRETDTRRPIGRKSHQRDAAEHRAQRVLLRLYPPRRDHTYRAEHLIRPASCQAKLAPTKQQQVASSKRQAASSKRQAPSSKRQAPSSEQQAARLRVQRTATVAEPMQIEPKLVVTCQDHQF